MNSAMGRKRASSSEKTPSSLFLSGWLSHQTLGYLDYIALRVDGSCYELRQFGAAHRPNIDLALLGVLQKVRVLHRGVEGTPHERSPVLRSLWRQKERSRHFSIGRNKFERFSVSRILREICNKRDVG